jgi:hypothetical protein
MDVSINKQLLNMKKFFLSSLGFGRERVIGISLILNNSSGKVTQCREQHVACGPPLN